MKALSVLLSALAIGAAACGGSPDPAKSPNNQREPRGRAPAEESFACPDDATHAMIAARVRRSHVHRLEKEARATARPRRRRAHRSGQSVRAASDDDDRRMHFRLSVAADVIQTTVT